jgi:hypothetical protein
MGRARLIAACLCLAGPARADDAVHRVGIEAVSSAWLGRYESTQSPSRVAMNGPTAGLEASYRGGFPAVWFGVSTGIDGAWLGVAAPDERRGLRGAGLWSLGALVEVHPTGGPWFVLARGTVLPLFVLRGRQERTAHEDYGGASWGVGAGWEQPLGDSASRLALTAGLDALQARGRGLPGLAGPRLQAWRPRLGVAWRVAL